MVIVKVIMKFYQKIETLISSPPQMSNLKIEFSYQLKRVERILNKRLIKSLDMKDPTNLYLKKMYLLLEHG